MDKFFSKDFFEIWLQESSFEINEWFLKEVGYLKERIKPGAVILDVGCGFGRHIQMLAGIYGKAVGVDNDEVMIGKAKKNLGRLANTEFLLQNGERMGFPDDSFDYVICMNNTFGNFGGAKTPILNEMRRVCKKGGEVIVSVYSENALAVRKNDYEKVGLHITDIDKGKVTTKEGLVSEQFSEEQLANIFSSFDLTARIEKLTSISYICILGK